MLHDLRIEHHGRVAQLDHVLINRALDVWVCESKHFADGIAINEHGEFCAFYGGRPRGVPSPLEQNRKHLAVLEALFSSASFQLPTRLGFDLKPRLFSVIVVSKNARISRPKLPLPGLDNIVKVDQLRGWIERQIEGESAARTLLAGARLVGKDTLATFARQLAGFHRPVEFDWAARFGLGVPAQPVPPSCVEPTVMTVAAVPSPPTRDRPADVVLAVEPTAASATSVAPASAGRTAPPAPAAAGTPAEQPASEGTMLSTSRLGARHGCRNVAEMLARLVDAGHLVAVGDGHRLTDQGRQAGGVFVEQSRYGPYFQWPAGLRL